MLEDLKYSWGKTKTHKSLGKSFPDTPLILLFSVNLFPLDPCLQLQWVMDRLESSESRCNMMQKKQNPLSICVRKLWRDSQKSDSDERRRDATKPCCDKNGRISIPPPRMLRHAWRLEVFIGEKPRHKNNLESLSQTPHWYCSSLLNFFPLGLRLQLQWVMDRLESSESRCNMMQNVWHDCCLEHAVPHAALNLVHMTGTSLRPQFGATDWYLPDAKACK